MYISFFPFPPGEIFDLWNVFLCFVFILAFVKGCLRPVLDKMVKAFLSFAIVVFSFQVKDRNSPGIKHPFWSRTVVVQALPAVAYEYVNQLSVFFKRVPIHIDTLSGSPRHVFYSYPCGKLTDWYNEVPQHKHKIKHDKTIFHLSQDVWEWEDAVGHPPGEFFLRLIEREAVYEIIFFPL